MGKNKHRQASTPESKKQAAIWCAIAIIAITVMVLAANPWKQQTSTTSTPQSSQSTQTRSHKQNKKKKTTKPSGTLQQQAQSMFTGDAEQIADDVRDLLNAPENSNVDTLGNLLYRHNRQDLAEATDLYDAIGQQKDIDTIRSLAREWYPQAMQAGIEASVYGQINVYGVTTKSERHKRSYWTRTADGNGIGGRKAPVPYGS